MFARHALVRRPSPRLADGLVTHISRSDDVDPELAQRQWDGYVAALRGEGWVTHEVPAAPDCPDSVFVEDTMVGVGGRTNAAGIEQLQAQLEPFGVDVVSVPLTKALHLKSAVTALPDGTIVGWEPVVDEPGVWGERFLAVPEEPGSHVVLLEDY